MTLAVLLLVLIVVLVLSHEAGHFLLAKWRGVRVDEFGIGFPPRLLSVKKGETRYSFNLLPLGGFVKIFGEDPSTELGASGDESSLQTHDAQPMTNDLQLITNNTKLMTNDDNVISHESSVISPSVISQDQRSFASQPLWVRSLIVAGGVLANLLAAWFIFSLLAGIGTPQIIEEGDLSRALPDRQAGESREITIVAITEDSPAKNAGLQPGDRLRGFESVEAVQTFIDERKGTQIILDIDRGGEFITVTAVPRVSPPEGEGALGIAMAEIARVAVPWWQAPWEGLKTTGEVFFGTFAALGGLTLGLLRGTSVAGDVTGPVGIASIVSEVSQFGLLPFFQLMAVLSVNLAVINLLPIPALDGGRLLFFAIEYVRRKPVSARVSHLVHTIGFAFLIALMLVITYRDIVRLL